MTKGDRALSLDVGKGPLCVLRRKLAFGDPLPAMYWTHGLPRRTRDRASTRNASPSTKPGRWALVTSANFTGRGHTRNTDVGILVEDPGFATRLVHPWRGLIESGLVIKA